MGFRIVAFFAQKKKKKKKKKNGDFPISPPPVFGIAASCTAAVRSNAFSLVSRAYSTISVADGAALLGVSAEEASQRTLFRAVLFQGVACIERLFVSLAVSISALAVAQGAGWRLEDGYFVIPPLGECLFLLCLRAGWLCRTAC